MAAHLGRAARTDEARDRWLRPRKPRLPGLPESARCRGHPSSADPCQGPLATQDSGGFGTWNNRRNRELRAAAQRQRRRRRVHRHGAADRRCRRLRDRRQRIQQRRLLGRHDRARPRGVIAPPDAVRERRTESSLDQRERQRPRDLPRRSAGRVHDQTHGVSARRARLRERAGGRTGAGRTVRRRPCQRDADAGHARVRRRRGGAPRNRNRHRRALSTHAPTERCRPPSPRTAVSSRSPPRPRTLCSATATRRCSANPPTSTTAPTRSSSRASPSRANRRRRRSRRRPANPSPEPPWTLRVTRRVAGQRPGSDPRHGAGGRDARGKRHAARFPPPRAAEPQQGEAHGGASDGGGRARPHGADQARPEAERSLPRARRPGTRAAGHRDRHLRGEGPPDAAEIARDPLHPPRGPPQQARLPR